LLHAALLDDTAWTPAEAKAWYAASISAAVRTSAGTISISKRHLVASSRAFEQNLLCQLDDAPSF
jgi:hypothetical protein